MKSFIYTIKTALLVAVALPGFSSCAGWLEEESPAQNIMYNFFKDKEQLESTILGIYKGLPAIYTNNSLGLCVVGTDEIFTTRTTGNTGPLDGYTFTAGTAVIEDWYAKHYTIIQRANVVVNRAPTVPEITLDVVERATAEAKFLRAWAYFRLVQAFGQVPLVLNETSSDDDYSYRIKRDSINWVYKAIIDDLNYAIDNVTEKTTTRLPQKKDGGRITHWAAKGLLAKVYLTMGTSMLRRPQLIPEYDHMKKIWFPDDLFQACRALCDDIMENGGFKLMERYGDIFLIQNKNTNAESIWEIQFSSEPGLGSQWSKQHGVFGSGAGGSSFQNFNSMVGTTAYKPVPSFWRYFKHGDARRNWSFPDYSITFPAAYANDPDNPANTVQTFFSGVRADGASTPFIDLYSDDPAELEYFFRCSVLTARAGISKYRWGVGGDPDEFWKDNKMNLRFDQANCPNNVIVLRYADIMLMRIEANMLANGMTTQEDVEMMNNNICARARGWNELAGRWNTLAEVPTMVDYTIATLDYEALLNERACELCFEFHRWFDLVRTGKLIEKVTARISNYPTPEVTSMHYLFPIPQREIDMSQNPAGFYQNPGYGYGASDEE